MLTSDEITEIFSITDDFCKEYSKQTTKKQIFQMTVKSILIASARCIC